MDDKEKSCARNRWQKGSELIERQMAELNGVA